MSTDFDHTGPRRSPRQRYLAALSANELIYDADQAQAIEHVERLHGALCVAGERQTLGMLARVFRRGHERHETIPGVYLWGSVGRGKTWIVDAFYDCVDLPAKLRIHFHSFMRRVHEDLRRLGHETDPLARVAEQWSRNIRLLCLDEFHVGDITDAMLLGRLLGALFARGVVLVATSNESPDQLYRGGLQRARFLPAIAVLKAHVHVVEIKGHTDYRLRALEQAAVYHVPLGSRSDASLAECFRRIAPEPGPVALALEIEGRPIRIRRRADGVVWFDFAVLCAGPRSTIDYIEIARCHHTVLISGIPRLSEDDNDAARRFINLIDEFYDRNVKVVVSAATEPVDLYHGTRLAAAFKRTVSRLHEMRTHDYLATPHLCD